MQRALLVAGVLVWVGVAVAGAAIVATGGGRAASRSAIVADVDPRPVSVRQGGVYWGVYLSAEAEPGAETRSAIARLRSRGIDWDRPRALCDHGAAAALDVPREHWVVSVYFATGAEARCFAESLRPAPLGVVRVRTFCAD